jgi:hypothetical protein
VRIQEYKSQSTCYSSNTSRSQTIPRDMKRVLRGLRCSVSAINEDGTDASCGLAASLRDLGAIVDPE